MYGLWSLAAFVGQLLVVLGTKGDLRNQARFFAARRVPSQHTRARLRRVGAQPSVARAQHFEHLAGALPSRRLVEGERAIDRLDDCRLDPGNDLPERCSGLSHARKRDVHGDGAFVNPSSSMAGSLHTKRESARASDSPASNSMTRNGHPSSATSSSRIARAPGWSILLAT